MFFYSRKLLLAILIMVLLTPVAGCSILGGPKKKPEVTREDVKSMVKEEMSSPETKKTMEEAVAGHQLEDLLQAPEADKLIEKKMMENIEGPKMSKAIQDQLKNALKSPDSQKVLQEHINKAMATPDVQASLKTMVQQTLTKMMQGGQQGGAGGGGGAGGAGGGMGAGGGGGQ